MSLFAKFLLLFVSVSSFAVSVSATVSNAKPNKRATTTKSSGAFMKRQRGVLPRRRNSVRGPVEFHMATSESGEPMRFDKMRDMWVTQTEVEEDLREQGWEKEIIRAFWNDLPTTVDGSPADAPVDEFHTASSKDGEPMRFDTTLRTWFTQTEIEEDLRKQNWDEESIRSFWADMPSTVDGPPCSEFVLSSSSSSGPPYSEACPKQQQFD